MSAPKFSGISHTNIYTLSHWGFDLEANASPTTPINNPSPVVTNSPPPAPVRSLYSMKTLTPFLSLFMATTTIGKDFYLEWDESPDSAEIDGYVVRSVHNVSKELIEVKSQVPSATISISKTGQWDVTVAAYTALEGQSSKTQLQVIPLTILISDNPSDGWNVVHETLAASDQSSVSWKLEVSVGNTGDTRLMVSDDLKLWKRIENIQIQPAKFQKLEIPVGAYGHPIPDTGDGAPFVGPSPTSPIPVVIE